MRLLSLLCAGAAVAAPLTTTTFDVALLYPNDTFGIGVSPGLRNALDEVNGLQPGPLNDALPGGYSLQSHEYADNKKYDAQFFALNAHSMPTPASSGFQSGTVLPEPGAYAILGHMYSGSSMTVASSVAGFGTPVLSLAATSDLLSDTSVYPHFRRVIGTNSAQVDAIGYFFKSLRWTHLFVIHSNEPYGADIARTTTEGITKYGVTVQGSMLAALDDVAAMDAALRAAAAKDVYVILIAGHVDYTAHVLSRAHALGMLQAPYIYMSYDGAATDGFFDAYVHHRGVDTNNATLVEETKKEADGFFAVRPTAPASQLRDDFCATHYGSADSLACESWDLLGRDSVDALTRSLTLLVQMRTDCDDNMAALPDYAQARCPQVLEGTVVGERDVLSELLLHVDFEGATGHVTLDEFGDRVGGWGVVGAKDGAYAMELGQVSDDDFVWFHNLTEVTWTKGHVKLPPVSAIPRLRVAFFLADDPTAIESIRASQFFFKDLTAGRIEAARSKSGDAYLDALDAGTSRSLVQSRGVLMEVTYYLAADADEVTLHALAASGVRTRVNATVIDADIALGSTWSSHSTRAASMLRTYETALISPAATSTELSDREAFPTFRRVVGSNRWQSYTLVSTLRVFDWRQVYVVRDTEAYSTDLYNIFTDRLDELTERGDWSATIIGETSFDSRFTDAQFDKVAQNIKDTVGALVIVFFGWASEMVPLMQALQRKGMLGAPYSLLTIDGAGSTELIAYMAEEPNPVPLEGVFAVRAVAPPLASNPARREFVDEYCADIVGLTQQERDSMTPEEIWERCDVWSLMAVDAAHLSAVAVDRLAVTESECLRNNATHPHFSPSYVDCALLLEAHEDEYSNGVVGAVQTARRTLMSKWLPYMSLDGLTGHVGLDELGERAEGGAYGLINLQSDRRGGYLFRDVALATEDGLNWVVQSDQLTWLSGFDAKDLVEVSPGVLAPRAVPVIQREIHTIDGWLFALMLTLVVLGCGMGVSLLYFNHKYGDKRIIRMSSPKVNNVALGAALLALLSIPLWGLDEGLVSAGAASDLCMARVWVSSLSVTSFFAALFAKLARVWRIFRNADMLEQVSMTLWDVLALVGIAVLGNLVILVAWHAAAPLEYTYTIMSEHPSPTSADIVIQEVVGGCSSTGDSTGFAVALLVYVGLLLFVGAALAYNTRHIEIPALNDARMIGIALYACAILFPVVVLSKSALALEKVNSQFTIVAFVGVVAIVTTMCVIFVPKILAIRQGTSDEWTTRRTTHTSHRGSSKTTGTSTGGTQHKTTATTTTTSSNTVSSNSTSQVSNSHSSLSDEVEIEMEAGLPTTN